MDIIVYGAGRASRIIIEVLSAQGHNIIGLIDDNSRIHNNEKYGIKILGDYFYLLKFAKEKDFFVSISIAAPNLMANRAIIFNKLKDEGLNFINVVHPTAYISPSANIGVNNFISPFVSIDAGTIIGDNNRICTHATIDHDCTLGDSNFVGPKAYIGSCSQIGNNRIFDTGQIVPPFSEIKN